MATYIPNATQTTEPTEDKTVESAALEFRTLKTSVNSRITTEITDRTNADTNLQGQINSLTGSIVGGAVAAIVTTQEIVGDGVTATYTLSAEVNTSLHVDLYIDGAHQQPSSYTVVLDQLTLLEVPHIGALITVKIGKPIGVGTTDALLVEYNPAGTGAVPMTVQAKLRESVSVLDFFANGASGAAVDPTGSVDSYLGIQAAIDAVFAAGGGGVFVPPANPYFKISAALLMRSGVTLYGVGKASRIHSVNTTRLGGIKAAGTIGTPLSKIKVHDINVTSTTTFAAGVPSVVTGAGIDGVFADDFEVTNCYASGWSDNGIGSTDGQRPNLSFNVVDVTGQGVQVFAVDSDVYGAKVICNTVTNTGTYNGVHTEGLASGGTGLVIAPIVVGNSSNSAYNLGVNVENSPNAVVSGNTSHLAGGIGAGSPTLIHGINLFGSPNASVTGNNSFNNIGYGVVLGANCDSSSVSGNTTSGNLGSCLVTDSSGVGTTDNVAMGGNSWGEGDVVTSGNVSFLNRTRGFKFSNVAVADATTFDWYEEGTFTPVISGDGTAGAATYTEQTRRFQRIGNMVYFSIALGWSAHTGTGDIAPIAGLPYTSANVVQPPVSIYNNGYSAASGTLQGVVAQSWTTITLNQVTTSTGTAAALPLDTSVADLRISGSYLV